MYYITNENNQIIAIDSMLLAILGVENIDVLYREIALENITFSSLTEDGKITVTTVQDEETYHAESHALSGILGNITLIQLQPFSEKSELLADDTPETDDMYHEKKLFDLIMPEAQEETIKDIPSEVLPAIETTEEENENNNELFDLILPHAPDDAIYEIPDTVKDTSPIYIDVRNISREIGITPEDYNTFLNEYIDTALSFEKDLQSTDEEKRFNAINMLSHLSNVLHLPVITEIVTQIENASARDQDKYIESFYATLARLSTSLPETEKEETETASDTAIKYFGSIDLSDIKPIHFDFQLEEAARELSLPVELIEEFVYDFIKQAHEETKKMLQAYEKGDLKSIQKIGHLLKGAASNLRIDPLADTLYEIQFCDDISKMENLIKHYWGHFLSLETQMNLTSK